MTSYHSLLSRVLMSTKLLRLLQMLACPLRYHSLLSRVLMSTQYSSQILRRWTGLPFPFITGAYVNPRGIFLDTGRKQNKVTIPFYHGCLCQLHPDSVGEYIGLELPFPFITGAYVNLYWHNWPGNVQPELPFPFITGAYVNITSFARPDWDDIYCYHSLLSRVLMSTKAIILQ